MPERRNYARKTWTETYRPWGIFTRARALCPDGRLRVVKLRITADTYFSVPARLSYKGKSVTGYISWASDSGLSTDPAQYVTFVPTGLHRGIFYRAALCVRLGVADAIPDGMLRDLAQDSGEKYDF